MPVEAPERLGARELRRRYSGLRSLWRASACSLTGTEAYDVVLLLLTTAAFGSVLSVGLLGIALRLSPVLIGPLVSTVLDRHPRQRAEFVRNASAARGVLVAVFAVVLWLSPGATPLLYTVIVLVSALDAVFLAGMRASMPRLFTGDSHADRAATGSRLAAANSMLITQWSAMQVLVPPVTVALLDLVDPVVIIALNAVTFLLSYGLLIGYVRAVRASYDAAAGDGVGPARQSYWTSLGTGFGTAFRDPVTRWVLLIAAVGQGIMFALLLALPTLADQRGLGTWTVGVGLAALALGALAGARFAARLAGATGQARMLLADPLLRMLSLLAFALAGHAVIALLGCLLMGLTAGASNVARTTLIQRRFADALLGRVLMIAGVSNQVLMPVMPLLWDGSRRELGVAGGFGVLCGLLAVVTLAAGTSAGLRALLRGREQPR